VSLFYSIGDVCFGILKKAADYASLLGFFRGLLLSGVLNSSSSSVSSNMVK
jgi:hypothetical protein